MLSRPTSGQNMLLRTKDLTVYYGKALALDRISLAIAEGSVATILGANGAGKSTFLKVLSGLMSPTSGEVYFQAKRIDGMKPYDIVKLGLIHVPEGRKLFPYLNVLENLKLGASLRRDGIGIRKDIEKVFEHFPILSKRCDQKAGSLSGGEQMMLAIGLGLMAQPKLLLMDEPSLGLSPMVIAELASIIKNIHESGISVLLVEQNVFLALQVADKGYVLEVGKVILEGEREQFMNNEVVKRAYLGD